MRPVSLTRRWRLRHPAVSPPWQQNPWLSSPASEPSVLRIEACDEAVAGQQQKAAIDTWEDEGGCIRTGVLRS